jgi:hypothetical protein
LGEFLARCGGLDLSPQMRVFVPRGLSAGFHHVQSLYSIRDLDPGRDSSLVLLLGRSPWTYPMKGSIKMAITREQLDAHLADEDTSIDAFGAAVSDQGASIATLKTAIADLQTKAQAGEDFAAEQATIDEHLAKITAAQTTLEANKTAIDSLVSVPGSDAAGNDASATGTSSTSSGTASDASTSATDGSNAAAAGAPLDPHAAPTTIDPNDPAVSGGGVANGTVNNPNVSGVAQPTPQGTATGTDAASTEAPADGTAPGASQSAGAIG